MLRYQVNCNDRVAAEAALDWLLLMTATFFDDMESCLEKSHCLALLRVTLKAFKINTFQNALVKQSR